MRVACLIDSLGPGGAQRQLALLAVLLQRRGMHVAVLTYHPHDFFRGMIEQAGVTYRCVATPSKVHRVLALRRQLRSGAYDVVLAFLDGGCVYAELAALPSRPWGLVVSERLAAPAPNRRDGLRRRLHLLADYVTTNSHTNRLLIERAVPRLAGRVMTVYNAVDLERFRPAPHPLQRSATAAHLVVAANYQRKKNLAGLIEAVASVRRRAPGLDVRVDWYGGLPQHADGRPDTTVRDAAVALIDGYGLTDRVRLHLATSSIDSIYRSADALILPSFFEGLPNAVCEAMASGLPILMSAVCDAGNLVRDGWNGFLFDPSVADDIARAIVAFASLPPHERQQFGERSRTMAEEIFDAEPFADHYVRILRAAARRERIEATHWLPAVPATAYQSLAEAAA